MVKTKQVKINRARNNPVCTVYQSSKYNTKHNRLNFKHFSIDFEFTNIYLTIRKQSTCTRAVYNYIITLVIHQMSTIGLCIGSLPRSLMCIHKTQL